MSSTVTAELWKHLIAVVRGPNEFLGLHRSPNNFYHNQIQNPKHPKQNTSLSLSLSLPLPSSEVGTCIWKPPTGIVGSSEASFSGRASVSPDAALGALSGSGRLSASVVNGTSPETTSSRPGNGNLRVHQTQHSLDNFSMSFNPAKLPVRLSC